MIVSIQVLLIFYKFIMIDRHFLQIQILSSLLFKVESTYSDLKPKEIQNNLFNFHLKSVQKDKLVEKNKNGLYELTAQGKEIANRYEEETSRVKRQGKLSVIFCPVRNISSKDPEILIYTRKKHPFYGSQGSPSGKISYGEKVSEAARRELLEETGLVGTPELFRIEHHRVYSKLEGKLLYQISISILIAL